MILNNPETDFIIDGYGMEYFIYYISVVGYGIYQRIFRLYQSYISYLKAEIWNVMKIQFKVWA